MKKDDTFRSQFRLPYELYEKLKEESDKNHRSLNAEIVARLQESFELSLSSRDKAEDELEKVVGEFGKMLDELKNNFEIKRKDNK
ncbi:Arc family DNA-binding protein [Halomonas sp. QX-2]|uniref:Arc family DNA-binding protein n=1 Tax=Vreelandella sedimenti TaxID=2729618 RepID=A0A7Z0SN07_9GAMM|nr:Arc family DNA-binding protein [Halomonas sedimenti]NYT74272.1 Arc family DNA-binding protein [Halomonas sedimenti]